MLGDIIVSDILHYAKCSNTTIFRNLGKKSYNYTFLMSRSIGEVTGVRPVCGKPSDEVCVADLTLQRANVKATYNTQSAFIDVCV